MALPKQVTASIILRKGEAFVDFGEPVSSADRNYVQSRLNVSTKGIESARFQHGHRRLTLGLAHSSRTVEKAKLLVMEVISSLQLELQGEIKVL